ncbi:hypothetical protein RUM44_011317, partial [Polyplax serrata]
MAEEEEEESREDEQVGSQQRKRKKLQGFPAAPALAVALAVAPFRRLHISFHEFSLQKK